MSKKWQHTDTAVDGTPLMLVSETNSYVSEDGRIFTYKKKAARERVRRDGYMAYSHKNSAGKWRTFLSHRTVALAFCHRPDGCDVVNHLNGIKTDNQPENLEWTTQAGNMRHAYVNGLVPRTMSPADVAEARSLYTSGLNMKEISARLGFAFKMVYYATSGGGYPDIDGFHERERTGNRKLSVPTVNHIKCLLVMGWSPKQIGDHLGINSDFISNIKRGKTYNV